LAHDGELASEDFRRRVSILWMFREASRDDPLEGAGSPPATWPTGSTSAPMMAVSVSAAVCRRNGGRPVAISYKIVPNEN
jgi:hypothetical protein